MTDPSGPSASPDSSVGVVGAACARCGDFAPLRRVGRRDLCAACVPRRHPILAEPPSAGLYVRWSFELLRTMGAPAALVSMATMGLFALASAGAQAAIGYVPGRSTPADIVLSLAMIVASFPVYAFIGGYLTALGVQAIDGYVDARAALRTGLSRMPALVGVSLGGGLVVGAGLMCCCVPGLVLGVLFALPVPAVIAHRCGPIDAIGRSVEVVRGAYAPLTLALTVTSLVWIVGSMTAQLPTLAMMFERMMSGGPEAMAHLTAHPPAWFRALTVVEAAVGALFLVPLANTATVVYLNRTEGAHAPGVHAG